MPRKPREYSKIKVYHVILRGINKQQIFLDANDKTEFLWQLQKTKNKYNYSLYAYCLMDNHVHIVIKDNDDKLSKIMQSLGIRYSEYFNKKYNRVGHLFQNRFLSKKVETRENLLVLCRYVHKNPKKAGISATENYKWSSYLEYINQEKLIDTEMLLSLFSSNKEEAKRLYIQFHNIKEDNYIYDVCEFEFEKAKDEQIEQILSKRLNINNVKEILNYNTEKRNKLIIECKNIKGITNRQIARILGIQRKIVDRAK